MIKNLNFDDVHLVPRIVSEIKSRDDIQIKVKLGNLTLTSPIIASPMKDVCDAKVAKEMHRLGGLGIIHRFMSIEDQIKEYKQTESSACAIGIDEYSLDRFKALKNVGCNLFCIDVANGASVFVKNMIEKISNEDISIIVGNVSSKECYLWLEQFDKVKAIRTLIATGGACTTKNATGVYYGAASCIKECASVKKRTLLIADGGVREPSDLCKAIALGADLVILGNTIAATSDSPAEMTKRDGKLYKIYHGSASYEIQRHYREKPKYIEGTTRLLEFNGETLENLVNRFCEGLRSSMSYFNAKTLQEFRNNATFVYN